MKIINYSEITPENIYKNRRSFIKKIGFGASTLAISTIPFLNKSIANYEGFTHSNFGALTLDNFESTKPAFIIRKLNGYILQ